jgi:hypothetical protein
VAPHYDALIGLQLLFILAQVWAGIDMPQPVGQELLFLAEHTDPAIVGLISRFNFETFQVLHISLKLSVRRGRISAAQMDVTWWETRLDNFLLFSPSNIFDVIWTVIAWSF